MIQYFLLLKLFIILQLDKDKSEYLVNFLLSNLA